MRADDAATFAPLEGHRVIDLSTGIAGGYCTKLLADFGADVIKVERPGVGDPVRAYPPAANPTYPLETGALHLYLNTNKHSATIDLNTPAGRHLVQRLLVDADVLVDDRDVGVLANQGFGVEQLSQQFPRLVVTQLSAFGQSGPYADVPATNLTALAAGGQMDLTGDPDREPLKNGGYQAWYQTGLNGFTATLAGLWSAGETGEGDSIDVNAMECMASTLELMLNSYCYLKADYWGGRRGNIMSAAIGIYPCADGYLGIHAMPRNWPALTALMDAEWMREDERFHDAAARLAHDDELRAEMYAWAADQTKKDAYARAGEIHAPVAYVHDMADLLSSPQLQARDYFSNVEHPLAGDLVYPGAPFHLSVTPSRAGRAPLLGEHNENVLQGLLGLTAEELEALRGQGVIA